MTNKSDYNIISYLLVWEILSVLDRLSLCYPLKTSLGNKINSVKKILELDL